MYVVLNIIRVRRKHVEEFSREVRKHAASSSAEPGCIRYDVLQDAEEPEIFCLYEVFADEAAFQKHLEYEHYKPWMAKSKDWRHDEQRIRHVLDYIYLSKNVPN